MPTAEYDPIADWYDELVSSWTLSATEPALFEIIGDVRGQDVCDLACGQGVIARQLSQLGARVVGVDISGRLLDIANRYETDDPLGVTYLQDDAHHLARVDSESFDGVVCNLSLMDVPDLTDCLGAVARVLRPGGWFVFCITHPCFYSPDSDTVIEPDGTPVRRVRRYFDEGFWVSDNPKPASVRAKVGAHHRTLSTYLNALTDAELTLERITETSAATSASVTRPDLSQAPLALIVRCQKGI